MAYKCLPVEHGVDISVNSSRFFTYKKLTHVCTDLGGNKVRISRRIDGLHELLNTGVEEFTDLNGIPLASTYSELAAYLNTNQGEVKAGAGVAVSNNTVSVIAGSPSVIGGFKVGTGLNVDGEGKLSASASSEVTKVLGTEAEMLGLVAEPLRPYRVIRLDTNRLYFLNAGDSPAVLSNWFVGPSVDQVSISFNGRTGMVLSEFGDYTSDLIPIVDKTSATTHKFVLDTGKLYIENISTLERVPVGSDADVAALSLQFTTLNDIVTNASTGLQTRLSEAETKVAALDQTVNNATTGLVTKVANKADLVAGKVPLSQLPSLGMTDSERARLLAVEDSAQLANEKGDLAAENNLSLSTEFNAYRVSNDTKVNDAISKNTTQDGRLTTLESKDSTYEKLANKGVANGYAPLDANSKVPLANLPDISGTTFAPAITNYADVTSQRVKDVWYTNSGTMDLEVVVTTTTTAGWSPSYFTVQQGTTGPSYKIDSSSGNVNNNHSLRILVPPNHRYKLYTEKVVTVWYELSQVQGSTFVPTSEKGVALGVAPLDSGSKVPVTNLPVNVPSGICPLGTAGKVPAANLLTNVSGGVPLLDTNARVAVANLPTFLPQSKRIWRDVTATRVTGTWYTNSSTNEMELHLSSANVQDGSYFNVEMRPTSGSAALSFIGNSSSAGTGFPTTRSFNNVTVPAGWEYSVNSANLGSRTITKWYELS